MWTTIILVYIAMILGIAIGTYSSIFFCSSLIEIWEDNKKTASA